MCSQYPILLWCVIHNQMYENECLHRIVAEISGKCIRPDLSRMDIKPTCLSTTAHPTSHEVMSSCYWALPGQLHPWYKPPTLKRKPSAMLPRSESPFPVDEWDSDSRVKRQRRITFDQTRSKKRNLPSPPQSPIASNDQHLPKRQRCTTLESGLERLSLTPPAPSGQQAPEFALCLPSPVSAALAYPPDFSSRGTEMSLPMPCSRPIPSSSPSPSPSTSIPFTSMTTFIPSMPTLTADYVAPDVKMRTSSWYEPEKDRTCYSFSRSCYRLCRR